MRLLRRHEVRNEREKSNNTRAKGSTENLLRLVWELVIWPLILEKNLTYFAAEEYRIKMAELCIAYEIRPFKLSGLLTAIVAKGLLIKHGNTYSIHSRHMQYMQNRVCLGYSHAVDEIHMKQ